MNLLSKYERRELRSRKLATALHGEGLYVYENNSRGDLGLPKPTLSGVKGVPVGGQFQGDNYFMGMVKTGELKLIRTITTPEQERERKMKNQSEAVETVEEPVEEVEAEKLLIEEPIEGVDIILE